MIPKCVYCDEGRYCQAGHEEVCPYWGDERCKCLEYKPEESHYGEFSYTAKEIIDAYKDQIENLRREVAEEIIEKLRKKASDNFQYYNISVVNLGDLTDVLEEYEDNDEVISLLPDIRGE